MFSLFFFKISKLATVYTIDQCLWLFNYIDILYEYISSEVLSTVETMSSFASRYLQKKQIAVAAEFERDFSPLLLCHHDQQVTRLVMSLCWY